MWTDGTFLLSHSCFLIGFLILFHLFLHWSREAKPPRILEPCIAEMKLLRPWTRLLAAVAPILSISVHADQSTSTGSTHIRRSAEESVEKEVHIAILSDRLKQSGGIVISSVCSSTTNTKNLCFHLFVEDSTTQAIQEAVDGISSCDGAKFTIKSISTATQQLVQRGFDPFWVSQLGSRNTDDSIHNLQWGVITPHTDDKHAAPLNLLRFYLPHLPEFDDVDNIVFHDDDVVVQKDIQQLLSLPHHADTALLAGCQHWQWKQGEFQPTYFLSVRDSKYAGNHASVCTEKDKANSEANCVSATLEEDISRLSLAINNGNSQSFFDNRPLDRQAFNMGLNVIDTKVWTSLGLTARFEKLVELNFAHRLFPSNTLAFGLVLGYFAIGDSFECYDSKISHVVGLAFIPQEQLDAAGYTNEKLEEDFFALHYNGETKPWELSFDHMCSNSSAPLEVSTDIWLRRCIDLGVCRCENKVDLTRQQREQQQREEQQRRLKGGKAYTMKSPKSAKSAKGQTVAF